MPSRRLKAFRFWSLVLAPFIALATLAGCATLDERQREWIFRPTKETWWAGPAAAEGMLERWIQFKSKETSEPVKLHALWLPQEGNDKAPVLLYLHGARWNVIGSASRMRRMHALGFSVLAVDYRGFGKSSEALPSEAMAYEDARAAWEWLGQQAPLSKRYLFGHSLGGAIAVNLATEVDDAAGLIVEGGFTSIPDVFGSMKWGWLPLSGFITQRFDAASRIGKVKAPVLVVHGAADSLISPTIGRALFERAPEPKRFILVEGGSHHNTNAVGQSMYREALQELFGMKVGTSM
jgi:uncharacterized protein